MRTVLFVLALAGALATGASAAMLGGATWTPGTVEDFSAYDPPPAGEVSFINGVLGRSNNCSNEPWAQWQLPQFKGYKEGGTNNVVNLQASSTTYAQRAAWRDMSGASAGDQFQRVSFRVKTALTTASDYTAEARASSGVSNYYSSNGVPMWDVSNLSLRPHVRTSWDASETGPEWIGDGVDISDGAWHTMDLVYDLTTGDAEWYKDGSLVATLPNDPALKGYYQGRPAEYFEFWQMSGGVQAGGSNNAPGVLFDDIMGYSAVPEPATLALLGLGGAIVLRRRRA